MRRKTTKKVAKKEEEIEGTIIDLAYPIKCYFEDNSPSCIYIPSNETLFKMMKACVGCQFPEDLWMFKMQMTSRTTDQEEC